MAFQGTLENFTHSLFLPGLYYTIITHTHYYIQRTKTGQSYLLFLGFHLIFFVKYRISTILCTPFSNIVTTLSRQFDYADVIYFRLYKQNGKKRVNLIYSSFHVKFFVKIPYFLYFVCPYSFIGTTTSGGLTMSTVPV